MGAVPDLALLVVVAAVDALAEAVLEAAEVAAALAVDPAHVLDAELAAHALGVGDAHGSPAQAARALVELEVVRHLGHGHLAVGVQDFARHFVPGAVHVGDGAGPLRAVRVLHELEEAAVVGHGVEHPVAQAGGAARLWRRRAVQGRPAASAQDAPRMVAEDAGALRCQLEALARHLDPALRASRHLVGEALQQQPAVDAVGAEGAEVRRPRRVAHDVAGDAEVVRLQHQPDALQRLQQLHAQGPRAVLEIGPQPPRHAEVVLHALVPDAHEPVQHVRVLVEPHGRDQRHVPVHVAQADVVPVVPVLVRGVDARERLRRLVEGVLVGLREHGAPQRAAAGWPRPGMEAAPSPV